MKVFRFWARAAVDQRGALTPDGPYLAVGWSDKSEADAHLHALKRAARLSDLFEGRESHRLEEYYVDRPPREPVESVIEHDGKAIASITRNIYGSRILNAGESMFVDLDTTPTVPRSFDPKIEDWIEEDSVIRRVAEVVQSHPGMGMRLYQTAAGFRGLLTDRLWQPRSDESKKLLKEFEADRLYARLCQSQDTYRARLTPKPWRCGIGHPYMAYPWANDILRERFEDWDREYQDAIQVFGTCRYLGVIGSDHVHESILPIIEHHDRETRADEYKTLA